MAEQLVALRVQQMVDLSAESKEWLMVNLKVGLTAVMRADQLDKGMVVLKDDSTVEQWVDYSVDLLVVMMVEMKVQWRVVMLDTMTVDLKVELMDVMKVEQMVEIRVAM